MVEPGTAEVKTYVTKKQKEIWKNEADDLDLTFSDFVRHMIQGGRREFALIDREETGSRHSELTEHVISQLAPEEARSFDEIKEGVIDEYYAKEIGRVLKSDDRAVHDPVEGGYMLEEYE